MKKNSLYALIIIALGIAASCSSPKSQNQNAQMQLFEDGKLVASIFKYNGKEYHIWTRNELKNSYDVLAIRNKLKIGKEFVTYLYNDSTLDEGHYYAYYQTLYQRNLPAQENAFIDGTDTIQLITHSNNSFDILTSRELNSEDVSLFKRALNYMNIGSDNTCFLYLKGNMGEDYYAAYNGVNIHGKITQIQKIENMISELKNGMKIESKGSIITFLDKIDRAKKLLCKNDNESLNRQLKSTLVSFQKTYFPKARKIYFQNAKNELREKDIEVELSGENITFIGYVFVKNQIIKDTYSEIKDEISKLRFKTIGFKALDSDDRTYWELDLKNDIEI